MTDLHIVVTAGTERRPTAQQIALAEDAAARHHATLGDYLGLTDCPLPAMPDLRCHTWATG